MHFYGHPTSLCRRALAHSAAPAWGRLLRGPQRACVEGVRPCPRGDSAIVRKVLGDTYTEYRSNRAMSNGD
eukprot:725733-Alexandrium_andersonii.AAC.1